MAVLKFLVCVIVVCGLLQNVHGVQCHNTLSEGCANSSNKGETKSILAYDADSNSWSWTDIMIPSRSYQNIGQDGRIPAHNADTRPEYTDYPTRTTNNNRKKTILVYDSDTLSWVDTYV